MVPRQIDLVLLDQVKGWLGLKDDNVDDDNTIQFLITSFSQYVLTTTGRSNFRTPDTFTEVYDGNGANRMFLNNSPITSVSSVVVGSYSVPFSTDTKSSGIYIEQSKKSLAFRSSGQGLMPPRSIYPYIFTQGIGNVEVVYTAGYAQVPFDLQEACLKAVAINYRRKDWIDLASKSLSAGAGVSGTITYRTWGLPPEINETLDYYSRYARP